MRNATLFAAFLLSLTAFDVEAGEISELDRQRLAHVADARALAISQAEQAGNEERAAIDAVMAAQASPLSEDALTGEWQCRIIKIGGYVPALINGWSECRISQTEGGLVFEALGEGQRLSGALDPYGEDSLLFVGAVTVTEDSPFAQYAVGPTVSTEQIGVLSMIGPERVRVELPYPGMDSVFDVIELQR